MLKQITTKKENANFSLFLIATRGAKRERDAQKRTLNVCVKFSTL